MYFRVQIGAAIFDHHKAVIRVGGMKDCGLDDPAGCDPKQNESIDILRSQDHVKVGTGEGAHHVLGDRNIVSFRCNGGMNGARITFKKLLVFCGLIISSI